MGAEPLRAIDHMLACSKHHVMSMRTLSKGSKMGQLYVCRASRSKCSCCKPSGHAQVLPPVMGVNKKPLEEAIQELDKLAKY